MKENKIIIIGVLAVMAERVTYLFCISGVSQCFKMDLVGDYDCLHYFIL